MKPHAPVRAPAHVLVVLLLLFALAEPARAEGNYLEVGPIYVEPRDATFTSYATTAYVKEGTRYTGESVPIDAYTWTAQVSCGTFVGSGPGASWDRRGCNDPSEGQITVAVNVSWQGASHFRYYIGNANDPMGTGADGLICKSDIRPPPAAAMIRATQIVMPVEMKQGEPAVIVLWAENLGDAQGQRSITLIARHESAAGYTLVPPVPFTLAADSQDSRVHAWTPPLAGTWTFHADAVLATGRVTAAALAASPQESGGPKLAVTKIATLSKAAYVSDPWVSVVVRVTNTGDAEGSGSFTLDARALGAPLERVEEFEVTVPAGGWREVTLHWQPEEAGSYELVSGGLVQPMTVYEGASEGPLATYDPSHQSGSNIHVLSVGEHDDVYYVDDPRTKIPIVVGNEGNDAGTYEFDVVGTAGNGSVQNLGHFKVTVPARSQVIVHVDRPEGGGMWTLTAGGESGRVHNIDHIDYTKFFDERSLRGCPEPSLQSGPPPPSYPLGPVIPTMTASSGSGLPEAPIDVGPGLGGTPTPAAQESPGPGFALLVAAVSALAILLGRGLRR